MVKAHILVTRPDFAQQASISCFEAAGFSCSSLPLLCIEPIDIDAQSAGIIRNQFLNLDQFNKLIFISRNAAKLAVDLIDQYWPQLPVGIDWIAIGPGTAAELNALNIDAKINEGVDSEALLQSDHLQDLHEQRILIVKGEGGRALLQQQLQERGAKVEVAQIYKRHACHYTAQTIESKLKHVPDAIMITSGEALEALTAIPWPWPKSDTQLLVPSARIAQRANSLGYPNLIITSGASDLAMLTSLNTLF